MKITTKTTKEITWTDLRRADLQLGDEIAIPMKSGRELVFEVAALDVYGAAAVLVTKDLVPVGPMVGQDTNRGGWAECAGRENVREFVGEEFPDELIGMIQSRVIKQQLPADGPDPVCEVCADLVWVPSEMELFGRENGVDLGDVHFPLYADERSRVKQKDGETWWYPTRSPDATSSTLWRTVYYCGSANSYNASHSYGVPLGFCLKSDIE